MARFIFPIHRHSQEIVDLAEFLVLGGALPSKARLDVLHIANPTKLPVMRGLCAARGYKLPEIVTPFELMEEPQ